MRGRAITLMLGITVVTMGCGKNSPASPTATGLGGNWTGTLTSTNWPTAAVAMQLQQVNDQLTGTWVSQANDWDGTITGTASDSAFTGTFTITAQRVGGGQRCTGTAAVSGQQRTDTRTIHWSSPGFSGDCTNLPLLLTWDLQR